jgi:5-methylcytosine-specific restriction endonuclease McrA
MSQSVVVLNADFSFLSIINWKSAVCLIVEGKAEVIKATSKLARNVTRSVVVDIPLVIRVIKYVRSMFKSKVPFSKRNIIIRDQQTCAYCGTVIERMEDCTIDHIMPRSKGGDTSWSNCVCACKPCNNKKADMTPREAKMTLKVKPYQPTITQYIQYFTKRYGLDELLKSVQQ